MNLKITNIQMKVYAEKNTMPTLQEVADSLCEDNQIEYVLTKSKKVASLEKITVGDATSIFTKLKEYPYEFEINANLKIGAIDGKVIEENQMEDFEENTAIGNITISKEEVNGEYVKVKIEVEDVTNVRGYGVLVNNELATVSAENSIVVPNLKCNTEYEIIGYVLDKNNRMKKSDKIKVKTLEYQYAYRNGIEYETLTGGWQRGAYNVGTFTKESDHLNLYQSAGATQTKYCNSCQTVNMIDVTKYSKAKCKIKFDNSMLTNNGKYAAWTNFGLCNPKFVSYDSINAKVSYSFASAEGAIHGEVLTAEIDISEINESIYTTIFFARWYGSISFAVNADIYEIWFEE